MGAAPEQRESGSAMSHDQLLASASRKPPAAAPRAEARDAVVVPLGPRAAPPRRPTPRTLRPADAPASRDIVTRIADYLEPRPAPGAAAPAATAVAAPRLGAHVGEIDALLCQHIEVQLDLIARHAPELVEPATTVLRSLELLLKLRAAP
jgi:hypothetical protein